MSRPALAVVLLALALPSCNVRRVPHRPPVIMPPVAYGLDPRAIDLLERCDAALRSHTALPSAPRADALTALSRQRLLLVMTMDELRKQTAALELRVVKARQGLRTQAQSELERALIDGQPILVPLGAPPGRPIEPKL